jgi:2,4-dienoyl-CoA reductase-like NADH-dependent reductase (Old Yellow Enzyme family)
MYLSGLKNRIVMAPMTRGFAVKNHNCNENISDYYHRRAESGIGLIITEGLVIHPSGNGYNNVPFINTKSRANSWERTIRRVHDCGTKIFAQLWHCGRISHTDFTEGYPIVSSTNNPATGINHQNNKPYGDPVSLTIPQIESVISMFEKAAKLALEVGFDGVEIHMGHGYLIDQFLDARINDRHDSYGGSIENRCRFALELAHRLLSLLDSNKIMIRISPSRFMGGIYEWPEMNDMLSYLLKNFDELGIRLLDLSCANADYYETSGKVIRLIRSEWKHLLVGGASLTVKQAAQEVEEGYLDLVTWGRSILANPDFVRKIENGTDLIQFENSMKSQLI